MCLFSSDVSDQAGRCAACLVQLVRFPAVLLLLLPCMLSGLHWKYMGM
jgi:hypothetical protein